MPRRHGHPKDNKPWARESWNTRKRRKRIGSIKASHKNAKKRRAD